MYFLETVEYYVKKQDYSYSRRALNVLHTWRWKQKAVCEDLNPLIEIMGENDRIVNTKTGEEVKRTASRNL